MATKINQSVMINGEKHWIRSKTMQEFTDKILKLSGKTKVTGKHLFLTMLGIGSTPIPNRISKPLQLLRTSVSLRST